jgi:hypothetical protein
MKLRLLTILAIAGFAFAGCGANKNDDGTTDSAMVDTTMTSPSSTDTTMTDTSTKMPDTVPVDSTRQ